MIYEPAEDSYLLQKQVKKFTKKEMKVLDLGTGSGIQAITAKKLGAEVLATDINQECIIKLKNRVKTRKSDLFKKIKEKFDLIIFNPPYLPEDQREPKDSALATTGGKKGNEIIIKFLKEAKKHLTKKGKILMVFSSLTPKVLFLFDKYNYKYKKLSKLKIDFEELYVYVLTQ
jgi:release factor glutamine methyltransferase